VQCPQQVSDPSGAIETGVATGIAGQQGPDLFIGTGRAQRDQQLGDTIRILDVDGPDGPGGQDPDRIGRPDRVQPLQEPGDVPRGLHVGLPGRPGGQLVQRFGGSRLA
jgi:hypothetical protein